MPGRLKRDREKAQEDAKDLLTEARKQQLAGIAADRTAETGDDSGCRKAAENEAKQVREAANLSIEQAKREAELQLRKTSGIPVFAGCRESDA